MKYNIPIDVTNFPALSLFDEEQGFKTSLNIIGEVMNVPMCALESILRANGYDEVDPDSICIDEKMLSVFADAYIRKMKNFFLSSVRNIENLSYEEFTDLNEFYNTFKKQEVKFVRRAEWSQIDTELIRTAFMDKIKELSPCKKSALDILFERIFDNRNCVLLIDDPESSIHGTIKIPKDSHKLRKVLNHIVHNRFYLVRQKVKKTHRCSVNIIRQLFVAARYHIFVADDVDTNLHHIMIIPLVFYNLKNNKYENRTTYQEYRDKQSSRRRQTCA
jgi:cellulose synthase/poly-beta-1,6-N-acetylglucosamine synthase-like glycosyltransferase